MSLPSKKFIIVVIGTVVIGTGLFFVLGLFNKKTTFVQERTSEQSVIQENNSSVLGNLIDENAGPFDVGVQNSGKTGNLTETLSKELLTTLILKGNTTVDEAEIGNALTDLFKESATVETPRIYSRNNVQETTGGVTDLKKYGNAFMSTIVKRPRANATDTLNTFERMLETGNKDAAKTLWLIAEEYRKMESDILFIPTPKEVGSLHIDFVNELRAIGNAVTDMGFSVPDPVRGTLGLSMYIKHLDRAWEILRDINTIFESAGIEFGQKESGYAWRGFQ